MKVGISTAALYLRYENREALRILRELGAECTELFLSSFSEYTPEFARSVLPEKGDLDIHSVHILTSQVEPQLFNPHPLVRMDSFAVLEGAMRAAQILGAHRYTFHGLTRAKRAARNPDNDDFDRLGGMTAEIFDFCARFGVTLCQENVEWSTYNRPGVFRRLKAFVPGLRGVLDLKQARLSGYDWREYLAEMGEDIAHVHLSDVTPEGKLCLPGKGIFPFGELFARLKDVGFDGPVILEPYGRDYGELTELRRAREFVCSLL